MAETSLQLSASTEIALVEPHRMMSLLCAYFSEHGIVRLEGRRGRIETAFGQADLHAGASSLKIVVCGKDDVALAYVKLSLAEHLLRLAEAEKPRIVWNGDGAAGSPLPYFREMTVLSARQVTPRMRRITLGGENLARFSTGGLHVRMLLPAQHDCPPVWPVMGEDGRPCWPEGAAKPEVRIYTLRRIDVDKGEVDIDFVLHDGDYPGAGFARNAKAGMRVGMTGPGGGASPQADWMLLAGDETALPAVARILEQLPATTRAVVRMEVGDAAEQQPLPTAARIDLQWLHRGQAPAGTTTLIEDAIGAVDWPGPDTSQFAWAGCEHRSFRAIRGTLRRDRGFSRESHLVAAYWRRGVAAADS